ncbi:helicase/secretion neighborhood CpaE-like protein [Nocardioides alpinus]|uniref:Helicase/secretion neighborhood CpaE-like protein n=1 Tax=Nocardioides alpinus TaxID=748909 RepID=A0A1I0ZCF5_9ACTN|nr:septum site-determining protein Ssd [Nocardioides alpinus]PKH40684.1 septum site determining protein [Nocardioides alpinus]SFB23324.1 helicase/secretion neighborhood CpaE-like protein [Nocardioides alpinus]
MPVLLLTSATSLHDAVVPLCAAAGVEVQVCAEPDLALAAWGEVDLVLVGVDLAERVVALAPPRRPGVHVVGVAPGDTVFRAAVELGAVSVVDLPQGAEWLVDALADVGERASPGRTIGVVGGAGGAGATTLACALAQSYAARAPTLLVDADPLGPGLDRLLGMEDLPGVRWEGLGETAGRLGARALRESVPRRELLGVLTWSGLRRRLDVPTARRILPAAVRGHDLVVLDLARQGGPALTELVDRCDDLLVVTPSTVPGLAATARLVADLGRSGRAGLVVRPGGLSDADAEQVTGLPVVAAVADQRGLAASVDRGLGPLAGRGPLARAARDLLAAAA